MVTHIDGGNLVERPVKYVLINRTGCHYDNTYKQHAQLMNSAHNIAIFTSICDKCCVPLVSLTTKHELTRCMAKPHVSPPGILLF